MAEFILKDWYGKEKTFDKETIYVQGTDGELMPFTHGTGSSAELRYVTFMSEDGQIEYGKKAVAVGDDCADPIARGVFSTPTRESDVQYNYTFYGWATEPNGGAVSNWNKAITEDKTVYANFSKAVRYYTITYYDNDGVTVLKTENLAYGTMPSYTPEKDGYKFVQWEPELSEVTGDTSYVSTWQVQLALADYTWAQLDAMSVEEAREKFELGDVKDGYALVGFEQDTKSDGTKAKMTFILGSPNKYGVFSLTTNSDNTYINGLSFRKTMINNPDTYVRGYSDWSAFAKSVQKKYRASMHNEQIASIYENFWIPSASEFGYIPDGTNVLDEGEAYEAFNDISFGEAVSPKYLVNNIAKNFSIGNRSLRTITANGALYLKSGTATEGKSVSNTYYTIGFCI